MRHIIVCHVIMRNFIMSHVISSILSCHTVSHNLTFGLLKEAVATRPTVAGLGPDPAVLTSSRLGLRGTRSSCATVNLSPLRSAKFNSGAFLICSNSRFEGLDRVRWWVTMVVLGLAEEMGWWEEVWISMGPSTGWTEVTQVRSSWTRGEEQDSPSRGLLVGDSFRLRQSGLSGWLRSWVWNIKICFNYSITPIITTCFERSDFAISSISICPNGPRNWWRRCSLLTLQCFRF